MRALALLLVFAATVRCFSQGTIDVRNCAPGVDAQIRDVNGQLCGPNCFAQLYVGPSGVTDSSLLTTNGVNGVPVSLFQGCIGSPAVSNPRTISGYAAGTTITVQIRAWAVASGASWESATVRGESNLIQYTLATVGFPVPPLIGLQPFSLSAVPEPSLLPLAAIGLFMVGVMRRRSRQK